MPDLKVVEPEMPGMQGPTPKKPSWFVRPAVVRLDLGDGQWAEVKEQITYGEAQRLSGAMLRTVKTAAGDNEVGVDFARYAVLKLQTWLVDWSFRDDQDKPVDVSPAAIENLTPEAAEALNDAIDAHVAARAEGKATSTSNGSAKR
jgi:hypothetical protein